MSKTNASCFIRGSKHLETIKALGLRPRAFITFSVLGTPDETLALVFDILLIKVALHMGKEAHTILHWLKGSNHLLNDKTAKWGSN